MFPVFFFFVYIKRIFVMSLVVLVFPHVHFFPPLPACGDAVIWSLWGVS